MTNGLAKETAVGVIGAGTMGAGIAQVAAQAGHRVCLFDAMAGAAERGRQRIARDLATLVERGRIEATTADALSARIVVAETLEALAGTGLVVEAVVEDLTVKRDLVAQLEMILAPDAIIATNTSSISVTAIARDAARPERVAGLHFFNPAPVMKLVEIVSGVATDPLVAARLFATAKAWGKVAVHARSTPGFIVNRVARLFYAEALRLLEEQIASPATIDALLVEGGGFRMGPFALMDLIGNDVNYAVTLSVFNAFYHEPRFRPSLLQLELVNAGRHGRKSGRGFFDYSGGKNEVPATEPAGKGASSLPAFRPGEDAVIDGVAIGTSDGRRAAERAQTEGRPVIICDLISQGGKRLGFSTSRDVAPAFVERFVATLSAQGIAATRLPDWPGLVVMRTVAMLANEGFEAVLQGVADEAGVDDAMRYGVNYPAGPIAWGRAIGLKRLVAVLDNLHSATGDPRYRTSLGLRMAAA